MSPFFMNSSVNIVGSLSMGCHESWIALSSASVLLSVGIISFAQKRAWMMCLARLRA